MPRKSRQTDRPTGNKIGAPLPEEAWGIFLQELCKHANVSRACEVANIPRPTAYDKQTRDPVFAKAWDVAYNRGYDALEEIAQERAFNGVLKPVFHRGREVGVVREFSDGLVQFLLRGNKSQKFKDRSEVTMRGGPVEPMYKKLTDEELNEQLMKRLGKKL